MAAAEDAAAFASWATYIAGRERATFAATTILICVLVPVWSAFDFLLEPAVAGEFLVLRLADVAVTLALWILIARAGRARTSRGAMLASATAVGVTIAVMLPQVDHYLLYVLGFSLVFWGCGLVLLWPVAYLVASFAIILATHLALLVVARPHASSQELFGSVFYLVSVSVISTAQLIVRRRLEHQAHGASFALERRNAELAHTVSALEASRAQLAASSALLADSLDAAATGRHVTSLLVPAVAEWAALIGPGPHGARTTAVAHADPGRRDELAALLARAAGPPALSRQIEHVAATPELVARTLGIAAGDAAAARWLATVPLIVRGQPTGAIVLGRGDRDLEPAELAFAEELSHRAALALENARLYRESEDAVRLREDFISIASHELRTPLGAQVLTVSSLLASTPPQDEKRPMLAKLERQVSHLTDQVNQLLDVSQLAAGRLVLDREDVDLVGLLREVVDKLADTARHAGSPVRLAVPSSLHGHWDRARFEQVISNLIANAIKYGRGQPLDVTLVQTANRALLSVTDRGVGIAEADRVRIFERFERAASARRYGGFGVGLWLARTIVDAMGGTIRVDSELGRGSTFSVEVPLVPPS
ncbi:MAG TPA: HAMP domain-containing sensor histidine kinase [Kofleriaceae bacterium]|nr:HAMP domain-containing sensor histidine kinase [Kofleriaceae bacterium]